MKRICLVIVLLSALLLFSCKSARRYLSPADSSQSSKITVEYSYTLSDEVSLYDFEASPYTVTAKSVSAGAEFVYTYYIVDDAVAGAVLEAAFDKESFAHEYYLSQQSKHPDACFFGKTVRTVLTENQLDYFGFSLDKLLFSIDDTIYDVTVNYNPDIESDESLASSD